VQTQEYTVQHSSIITPCHATCLFGDKDAITDPSKSVKSKHAFEFSPFEEIAPDFIQFRNPIHGYMT
tara:strand:+ start:40611 stop:40811 length:201 start_codon:yes stop_codon:yes gene_type:complete